MQAASRLWSTASRLAAMGPAACCCRLYQAPDSCPKLLAQRLCFTKLCPSAVPEGCL